VIDDHVYPGAIGGGKHGVGEVFLLIIDPRSIPRARRASIFAGELAVPMTNFAPQNLAI